MDFGKSRVQQLRLHTILVTVLADLENITISLSKTKNVSESITVILTQLCLKEACRKS